MKKALGYRLFRAGRFPPGMPEALGDFLFSEEGVALTFRRRIRAERGIIMGGNIRLEACGLAVAKDRVVILFRKRVVDARIARGGEAAHGLLEVSADALEISFDAAKVFDRASGEVRLRCKGALPPEVRATLPNRAPIVVAAPRRLIERP